MSVGFDALRELAEKYRALLQMCIERDAFEAVGVRRLEGEAQRERHARARSLARRFPGCLRELDGATEAGLRGRLAAIEKSAEEPSSSPLWMRVVVEFHAELRELLAIRAAIGRGESVGAGDRARVTSSERLHDLVFEQLAARHGLTREIVRAIVHEGRCER